MQKVLFSLTKGGGGNANGDKDEEAVDDGIGDLMAEEKDNCLHLKGPTTLSHHELLRTVKLGYNDHGYNVVITYTEHNLGN